MDFALRIRVKTETFHGGNTFTDRRERGVGECLDRFGVHYHERSVLRLLLLRPTNSVLRNSLNFPQ